MHKTLDVWTCLSVIIEVRTNELYIYSENYIIIKFSKMHVSMVYEDGKDCSFDGKERAEVLQLLDRYKQCQTRIQCISKFS
jgi:hypothetical protein